MIPLKEIRDILFRVRVLLEEDVEELGKPETARHQAALQEIDRILNETKTITP